VAARSNLKHAVILPVGPGKTENVLDTIDSILFYEGLGITLFVVDDCTNDGTFEALRKIDDERIVLIRNQRSFGYHGLHVTVANALRECVKRGPYATVFRIDWDALITGSGVCDLAFELLEKNPHVGIFGRHLINYDGTSKRYNMHTQSLLDMKAYPTRDDKAEGGISWICDLAIRNGWGLGENIFGGAFFMRFQCVQAMLDKGFLDDIENPNGWVIEDVFFTMCALAAGFDRAHFAAPTAPLALAFRGLPASAEELHRAGMKVIHSVDKGPWTTREENGGLTPREFFARLRRPIAAPRTQQSKGER
jgi:hypothetical protein